MPTQTSHCSVLPIVYKKASQLALLDSITLEANSIRQTFSVNNGVISKCGHCYNQYSCFWEGNTMDLVPDESLQTEFSVTCCKKGEWKLFWSPSVQVMTSSGNGSWNELSINVSGTYSHIFGLAFAHNLHTSILFYVKFLHYVVQHLFCHCQQICWFHC